MREACLLWLTGLTRAGILPVFDFQPRCIKMLLSAGADRSSSGAAAAARRPRRASAAAAAQQLAGGPWTTMYSQAGLSAALEEGLPGVHGLDPLLILEDSAAELQVPLAVLAQQVRARGAAEDSMPLAQLAALHQRQAARRSGCTAGPKRVGSAGRPGSAEIQRGMQRAAQERLAGSEPQQGVLQEPAPASQQSSEGVGPLPPLLLGGALTGIEVPGSSKAHAAAALPPQILLNRQTRLGSKAVAAQLPELTQLQAGSAGGVPPEPAPLLQQKQQGLGSLYFGQAQHEQGQQALAGPAAPQAPLSAWAPASQETLNHPDNMGDIYVEYDLCKKWRHLPKGHEVGS